MGKVPPEERTPYVVVAFQECERMNGLTSEIKRTLKELDLGLKVYRIGVIICMLVCMFVWQFKLGIHFREGVDCISSDWEIKDLVFYTPAPLFYLCPSKIFSVAFFSVTIDGRNLICGHKLHIGMPYFGKRFWTIQIPISCLPT